MINEWDDCKQWITRKTLVILEKRNGKGFEILGFSENIQSN